MAHCLVIDSNFAGIRLLGRLLRRGHRVTFLRPPDAFFQTDADALKILSALDRIVDISGSHDTHTVSQIVLDVHAEDPVDAIFCVFERSIEAAAYSAAAINVPFTSVDAVHTARHKNKTREALARAGLPTARCRTVGTFDEVIEYAATTPLPFVIKPISGVFSSLVRVVRSEREVATLAADLKSELSFLSGTIREYIARGFMIEDYLPGTLVSVEIGRRGDQYYDFMVSGRFRAASNEAIELGSFLPARISASEKQACFAYARNVLEAIGLDVGIFHLEMIVTPSGPCLVEANARLMGGMLPFLYDFLTESSIHEALIDIVLGDPLTLPTVSSRRSVSSFALKTTERGVVSPDFVAQPPDEFRSALARCDFYVQAGQKIDDPTVLARLQVVVDDGRNADDVIIEISSHVAKKLGVTTLEAAPGEWIQPESAAV